MRSGIRRSVFCVAMAVLLVPLASQARERARDLGVPFDGATGPHNAITDVPGVAVGYSTLISGEGPLVRGKGPVRTGVTAILPRGRRYDPVFAGWSSLNGNGEMTGTAWLEESGFLEGMILLTNTHSVGTVRDAAIEWQYERDYLLPPVDDFLALPVVAETADSDLNDIGGFHVKREHVYAALDDARSGPIAEGNVGGGTGMNLYEFKGGTGTASRKLSREDGGYIVGALVQGNYGQREQLTIAGVPVGKEISESMPKYAGPVRPGDRGSIIAVVATDAPLLPHQLRRLARRVDLAIGRLGGTAMNGSGEIFIAFSTANPGVYGKSDAKPRMLDNEAMDPLFTATIQAAEEAVVNAMVAAQTMTGRDGNTFFALPHERLREVLAKYGRLGAQGSATKGKGG